MKLGEGEVAELKHFLGVAEVFCPRVTKSEQLFRKILGRRWISFGGLRQRNRCEVMEGKGVRVEGRKLYEDGSGGCGLVAFVEQLRFEVQVIFVQGLNAEGPCEVLKGGQFVGGMRFNGGYVVVTGVFGVVIIIGGGLNLCQSIMGAGEEGLLGGLAGKGIEELLKQGLCFAIIFGLILGFGAEVCGFELGRCVGAVLGVCDDGRWLRILCVEGGGDPHRQEKKQEGKVS